MGAAHAAAAAVIRTNAPIVTHFCTFDFLEEITAIDDDELAREIA